MYPWKCEFSKFRNIAVLLTNYWKHNINCPTCTVSEWGKNQLSSNLYIESLALSDIHVSTAIQYVIASMKILIGILIVKHLYIISEPHPTSTCFWVCSLSICSALCGSPCCADSEKFSVQWVTSYSLLISCWPVSVIKLAVETASITMEIREKSGECPLILQMRGAYRFLNFGSYEICLLCLITTALLKKKYGDVHGIISQ